MLPQPDESLLLESESPLHESLLPSSELESPLQESLELESLELESPLHESSELEKIETLQPPSSGVTWVWLTVVSTSVLLSLPDV